MRIWLNLVSVAISTSLDKKSAFLSRCAFMFLNNLVFFIFWLVVFRNVDNLYGVRLPDMTFLYGIGAVSFGIAMAFFAGGLELPRMIRAGELDRLLLLPRSTFGLVMTSKSEPSCWGDIISGILLVALSGYAKPEFLGPITLSIILGTILIAAFGVLTHSLIFFVARSDEAAFRLWEMLITFALYPDSIFGASLRFVLLTAIPASLIGHLPLRMLMHGEYGLLGSMTLATICFVTMSVLVFRTGLSRFIVGEK